MIGTDASPAGFGGSATISRNVSLAGEGDACRPANRFAP
jgi:hypothetical protein